MASPLIPLVRTAEDRVGSIRPAEGSSTVSLLVGDSRRQTFNIAAPKAVNLPSVGILAGERVIIKNVGTALLTIQSASGSLVATVQGTTFTGTALVDSPTAATHWEVSNPGENVSWSGTAADFSVSTTLADWTNSALVVPSRGLWLLTANLSAQANKGLVPNGQNVYAKVTDTSNSIVPGCEGFFASYINSATEVYASGTIAMSAVVNIVASTTYKIRVFMSTNTSNANGYLLNSGNAKSNFFAVRLN